MATASPAEVTIAPEPTPEPTAEVPGEMQRIAEHAAQLDQAPVAEYHGLRRHLKQR